MIETKKAARDLAEPDGLADVVPTDQGSVPSLRCLAMYEGSYAPAIEPGGHTLFSTGQFVLRCRSVKQYRTPRYFSSRALPFPLVGGWPNLLLVRKR